MGEGWGIFKGVSRFSLEREIINIKRVIWRRRRNVWVRIWVLIVFNL